MRKLIKKSEEIFESLLYGSEKYKNKNQEEKNIIKSTFIEIHERMMKKKYETIDPKVTLRNLKIIFILIEAKLHKELQKKFHIQQDFLKRKEYLMEIY